MKGCTKCWALNWYKAFEDTMGFGDCSLRTAPSGDGWVFTWTSPIYIAKGRFCYERIISWRDSERYSSAKELAVMEATKVRANLRYMKREKVVMT